MSVGYGKLSNMLSEQDITQLREALAAGRPATVWFTAKAVGVSAGKSGKVISFAEPAVGDFIEVRPAGAQDTLSFAKAELTVTRPKRQPAAKKPAAPQPPPPEPEMQVYRPAPIEKPEPKVTPKQGDPSPAAQKTGTLPAARSSARKPDAESRSGASSSARQAAQPRAGAQKSAARRGKPPAEVTVTLNSTPQGEWTVEVVVGKKRTVRPVPVPAGAIAKVAKELPGEVEEAISAVMAAAREQYEDRVAQLQAELEAARRALDDLS